MTAAAWAGAAPQAARSLQDQEAVGSRAALLQGTVSLPPVSLTRQVPHPVSLLEGACKDSSRAWLVGEVEPAPFPTLGMYRALMNH